MRFFQVVAVVAILTPSLDDVQAQVPVHEDISQAIRGALSEALSGNWSEAEQQLDQLVSKDPGKSSPFAWLAISFVRFNLGKIDEVSQALKTALDLDPQFNVIRKTKEFEQVLAFAERFQHNVGWIRFQANDPLLSDGTRLMFNLILMEALSTDCGEVYSAIKRKASQIRLQDCGSDRKAVDAISLTRKIGGAVYLPVGSYELSLQHDACAKRVSVKVVAGAGVDVSVEKLRGWNMDNIPKLPPPDFLPAVPSLSSPPKKLSEELPEGVEEVKVPAAPDPDAPMDLGPEPERDSLEELNDPRLTGDWELFYTRVGGSLTVGGQSTHLQLNPWLQRMSFFLDLGVEFSCSGFFFSLGAMFGGTRVFSFYKEEALLTAGAVTIYPESGFNLRAGYNFYWLEGWIFSQPGIAGFGSFYIQPLGGAYGAELFTSLGWDELQLSARFVRYFSGTEFSPGPVIEEKGGSYYLVAPETDGAPVTNEGFGGELGLRWSFF